MNWVGLQLTLETVSARSRAVALSMVATLLTLFQANTAFGQNVLNSAATQQSSTKSALLNSQTVKPVEEAFRFELNGRRKNHAVIAVTVAPGTYLYRDKLSVQLGERPRLGAAKLGLPKGEALQDAFFGKVRALRGVFEIEVPLVGVSTKLASIKLELASQGCADVGVCYPPQSQVLLMDPETGLAASAADSTAGKSESPDKSAHSSSTSPKNTLKTVNSITAMKSALAAVPGKPAMVDLYADWCLPCKHMATTTLSDPRVKQALEGFNVIKVDLTRNDIQAKAVLAHFGLPGPPGMIFYDGKGQERDGARIMGVMAAEPFLKHLASVR